MTDQPASISPEAVAGDSVPTPTPEAAAIITKAVADISHIATLPEVTMKIIQLVEDPDSTAQDLNKVITNDPALGARILKVVNSAFYGLPGQIGSINRAIVLLGLNAVKNIAIAASLSKLFRGGKISESFDARDLWTHCIATATTTRMLASKAGLGLPDEAFLAGLIHDIGLMVQMQAMRAKFVETIQYFDEKGCTFREAEMAVIGATHEQFGMELCRTWKFPVSFQYVTGFHHRPQDLAETHRALASLVCIADHITARLKLGFCADVAGEEFSPKLKDELKLTTQDIKEVCAKLPEAIEEAQAVFNAAAA